MLNSAWTIVRLDLLEKLNPVVALKERFIWKQLATDMAELNAIEIDQNLLKMRDQILQHPLTEQADGSRISLE